MDQTERKALGDVFDRTIRSMNGLPDVITMKATTVRSLSSVLELSQTTIAECACLWAVQYGHREFVCLIDSDESHATDMLESIKTELDGNDLLSGDFSEVCHPIRCLDGIANRCGGQLYKGERTHISWTATEIVLPTIADSKAGGAIIKVAGITGRIRGMKFKRADGKTTRPSLVVLDSTSSRVKRVGFARERGKVRQP